MSKNNPDCYPYVMGMEYKRFLESLEEVSDALINNDKEQTAPGRLAAIHRLAKTKLRLLCDDYLMDGFGEMLTTYKVSSKHKLIPKTPGERSQAVAYSSSLRAVLNSFGQSFFVRQLMSSFKLDEVRKRLEASVSLLLEFLKNFENVANWTEQYMTWIDHGAKLAHGYYNTNMEENEMSAGIDAFYMDSRVRAYALFKTVDYMPEKVAEFLNSLNNLISNAIEITILKHRIYASLNPEDFEYIFNLLVSKKSTALVKEKTEFENVHELNEYIRQRMKNSLEEPDGIIYNMIEMLDAARDTYIDKLASAVIDSTSFLPDEPTQRAFTRRFEDGRIWR